jgi:DnaK suppressor protein
VKAAAPQPAPKPAVKKVRDSKDLTDEDILRAPEKDYMNEAQLAFFKQKLIDLRAQLLNNADDTGQHLRENEIFKGAWGDELVFAVLEGEWRV